MLVNQLARDGQVLFRYRGVLPLLLILPLGWCVRDFRYLNGSVTVEQSWRWFCLLVSMIGLLIRFSTIGFVPRGTSGRNTRSQVAAELNCTGWYSVTRNPLYLGNFLMGSGFVLASHDPAALLIFTLSFWLYYERIIAAEEAFLSEKFGDRFRAWAAQTPVFIPAFSGWRRPDLPFSWRSVLRREYCGVLLVGTVFFLSSLGDHLLVEQAWVIDWSWGILFVLSLLIFAGLRILKKRTRLLEVDGR